MAKYAETEILTERQDAPIHAGDLNAPRPESGSKRPRADRPTDRAMSITSSSGAVGLEVHTSTRDRTLSLYQMHTRSFDIL